MYRTILVPLSGTDGDPALLAAAEAIGRAFDAHLIFLHVGYDWVSLAATMAGLGTGLPADSDLVTKVQENAAERSQAARAAFQDFCRSKNIPIVETPIALPTISAEYRYECGNEADIVAAYGRTADLVLMPREKSGMAVPVVAENTLFDCGRPLLILGGRPLPRPLHTVAIAWKATREAARAVAAAMPFIERAERALIIEVGETAPYEADDSARLTAALQWHRSNVTARFLPAGPEGVAPTIMDAAREGGADLLVMGGYGHGRFRQFIFGGVTDAVMIHAALPILIAH